MTSSFQAASLKGVRPSVTCTFKVRSLERSYCRGALKSKACGVLGSVFALQGRYKSQGISQVSKGVFAMAPSGGSTGHAIKLIASDVDGTLLNHKQELTETVERAVQLARSAGVQVNDACIPPLSCSWPGEHAMKKQRRT